MTWATLVEAAEAVRAEAAARDPGIGDRALVGIGWATVEHERALRELDELLASDGRWTRMPRDPALGARSWLRQAGGAAGVAGAPPALVVLEPDTEGRLAASLARFGEGVAVVYLGAGTPGPGPLVRGGPAWGPHAILVGSRPLAGAEP